MPGTPPRTVTLNGEYIRKSHPEYSKLYFRDYRSGTKCATIAKLHAQYFRDWKAANVPEGWKYNHYKEARVKTRAEAIEKGVDPLVLLQERGLLTQNEKQKVRLHGLG